MATSNEFLPCVLLLSACTASPERDLMAEARAAVLDLIDDPSSTRFDDADVVVLQEQGLVCGGKVRFKTVSGEYTAMQPYYFDVARGAALPDHDGDLYATLMRECGRALD